MPITASMLRHLSSRYSKKKVYDVSDALAISAACAGRGDIFGKETWLDLAVERLHKHGMPVPLPILASDTADLAA